MEQVSLLKCGEYMQFKAWQVYVIFAIERFIYLKAIYICFFQAALVVLAIYLGSNILVFEKKNNGKEIDDIEFRLSPNNQHNILTSPVSSTTELPVTKDKCEPLYVLVYVHCCVWFLFLVSYKLTPKPFTL